MHVHATHPDIIKRLKRADGHLKKIISMLEEDKPCLEVAQQMQAVYSAIGNAKRTLVQDHIEGCIDVDEGAKPAEIRKKIKELKEITKYL